MWRKLFGVGDLDGAAFTRLVAKTGIEIGRFENPDVDPEKLRITQGSDALFLDNVYAQFRKLPRRERMAFIRDVVLAPMPDVPDTWEGVKTKLLPTVRDGAYLTIAKLQLALAGHGDTKAADIANRTLAPGLFETLVIDTPQRMAAVTNDSLAEWGVSFDEARELAHANLRRASDAAFQQIVPGLWVAPWSDSYAAARVVLPELLQRVCANPLIAVPNRDTLLIADPSLPQAFEKLLFALEKAQADGNPYGIASRIYQLDEKTLRLYEPPAEHPKAIDYEKLVVGELANSYEQEKELHAQLGTDAFYAKLLATLTPDGTVMTRATWTKGVDEGYLPPAKAVQFIELDDAGTTLVRIWEAPWEKVEKSGMLTPTNSPLPRWKTGTYPTVAWLESNSKKLKDTATPA